MYADSLWLSVYLCSQALIKKDKKRGHHLNGQKGMERIACTELNSAQNIQVVFKIYYNFNKKASHF